MYSYRDLPRTLTRKGETMQTQEKTLTETEIADLLILVGMSLGQWRDAKSSKETYESFPAMIDGRISSLTELHAKLEVMLND
jgi:hypothetical protein